MASQNVLTFEGCNYFRQWVLIATLSSKSVKIIKVREHEENPGFTEYEKDLLRLIAKLSKGSSIKFHVNNEGAATGVTYHPGILDGGRVKHDCDLGRGIGYYLELVVCLAPFMKQPLNLILTGITNCHTDVSVDAINYSTLPILVKFLGTDEGLSLTINKRGVAPDGGGEINFCCPIKQKLRPVQEVQSGKVCKIRGVSWTQRVSPDEIKRMTSAAKEILGKCLSDIFITSDHRKKDKSGNSPGFGLVLVASTISGECYCSEALSNPKGSPDGPRLPEDVGREAAIKLLLEISKGGCVDSQNQFIACTLMTLNDKDVNKMLVGPLTDYSIYCLRNLKEFLGVTFKIEAKEVKESEGKTKYLLTCVGTGYKNLSRQHL